MWMNADNLPVLSLALSVFRLSVVHLGFCFEIWLHRVFIATVTGTFSNFRPHIFFYQKYIKEPTIADGYINGSQVT